MLTFLLLMLAPTAQAQDTHFTIDDMHVVGDGYPGRPPIWIGDVNHFPGGDSLGRGGEWTGDQRSCPEGEFAAVKGTTDDPKNGIFTQRDLDNGRAAAVSHRSTKGAYVMDDGRTPIPGQRAATVSCVTPAEIRANTPEGEAIAGGEPSAEKFADLVVEEVTGPANLLVGMAGTFRATVRNVGSTPAQTTSVRYFVDGEVWADIDLPALGPGQATTVEASWTPTSASLHMVRGVADPLNRVGESVEWNNTAEMPVSISNPAAIPATATTVASPSFVSRWGPWTGVHVLITEKPANGVHVLAGGFVSFRLSEHFWLEPFIGFGSDGFSSHPNGYDESGFTYDEGWFLGVMGGARLEIVVKKWEGSKTYLLLHPGLTWVGDDFNWRFEFWGGQLSGTVGAEVWWDHKFPIGVYAESGVTRVSLLNEDAQPIHGWGVPVSAGVRLGF